ncbi:MAG TPA: DUF92 domain-containing protein, partial [Gemmatimonadales bacterium]|nr:DUF92 domain-containing protein [Gemmatimonadales bacterium]
MRLAGAALASLAAALLAWRAGTLTRGGAVAATLVGTAVLAGTGWPGAAALAAFFVSSNLVDRLVAIRHPAPGEAKGSRRDQWQVLANGGPAAVGGLLGVAEPGLGLWVVSASLAAAGADTWATALGATSPHPPRHVLTRTPVPPGTSGGVTLRGTLGG